MFMHISAYLNAYICAYFLHFLVHIIRALIITVTSGRHGKGTTVRITNVNGYTEEIPTDRQGSLRHCFWSEEISPISFW
jgi:hypothetical protein